MIFFFFFFLGGGGAWVGFVLFFFARFDWKTCRYFLFLNLIRRFWFRVLYANWDKRVFLVRMEAKEVWLVEQFFVNVG